eukprot:TRINITY_DN16508_c0_g1_i1.p3 TRINITY_DN16508_c0_g1~~TRINITY_DN16508_c0_g1_i1.p3  ORF type:complete len:132 (+),score=38.88 TRINITY_DN16508_c0_g1_i1:74-469(+)
MASASVRLQEAFLRYGKVGLGVHICLSTMSLGSCYYAVRRNLPMDEILRNVGLGDMLDRERAKAEAKAQAQAQAQGDAASAPELRDAAGALASAGGAAVAAFVLHKALFPVRVPVTLAVTPLVLRLMRRPI